MYTKKTAKLYCKNPNKANIVFRNPHVSNIHCSISYNAQTNRYIVKDHSSNGTL